MTRVCCPGAISASATGASAVRRHARTGGPRGRGMRSRPRHPDAVGASASAGRVRGRGRPHRNSVVLMDITTVNDRHLYQARVTVRDPQAASGRRELPDRVVRFGPPGWLTLEGEGGSSIDLYPTTQVVSVTSLREVPGQS